MAEEEMLNFAMKIVKEFELDANGYEILGASDNINTIPNFVIKITDSVCFIVVKAAIVPCMPKLSNVEKENILGYAKQFNARCFFAPVGFGSTDNDRFNASIALRGDGYYSNYRGLEEITNI